MTIRHLRVFLAVAENGSMTRAAELLHVAQPAVSYSIAEIEKYYQIKLFDRINQRLIITDFGRTLLKKAKAAVASFEEFERHARQSTEQQGVKIGASLTIGKTLIPRIIEKIKASYPDVAHFVSINTTPTIEAMVADGALDFALVEGKVKSENIKSIDLAGDRLIAVCKKNLNIPTKIYARELSSFPMLLREKGSASRELIDKLFSELDIDAKPFIESSSNEALISAAKSGLGIAILPSVLLTASTKSGELSEIEIKDASLERKYYLIRHKTRRLSETQASIFENLSHGGWENSEVDLT